MKKKKRVAQQQGASEHFVSVVYKLSQLVSDSSASLLISELSKLNLAQLSVSRRRRLLRRCNLLEHEPEETCLSC